MVKKVTPARDAKGRFIKAENKAPKAKCCWHGKGDKTCKCKEVKPDADMEALLGMEALLKDMEAFVNKLGKLPSMPQDNLTDLRKTVENYLDTLDRRKMFEAMPNMLRPFESGFGGAFGLGPEDIEKVFASTADSEAPKRKASPKGPKGPKGPPGYYSDRCKIEAQDTAASIQDLLTDIFPDADIRVVIKVIED